MLLRHVRDDHRTLVIEKKFSERSRGFGFAHAVDQEIIE